MRGEEIGGYRLVEELGTGGMATVYLAVAGPDAEAVDEGRRVAVKLLHPHLHSSATFLERFLREAEMGRRVLDRNVVRTLDAGTGTLAGATRYFLVMEYVEGQTLRALLGEMGRLNERLCRHVGHEVASALSVIHEGGVVHRDIKPENVLITEGEEVLVMDLGVAVLKDQAIRLSRTGGFVGSVDYAAPEQLGGGGGELDGRLDLYALGLLLYELVTGENPLRAETIAETIHRQLEEAPEPPSRLNPQVSPFLDELVLKLLSKEREERFQTAAEVRSALREGEDGAWWQSVAGVRQATVRPPILRMRIPRETSLFGRGDAVEMLRGLWESARSGAGRVLILEGEAGIGKTRLVDEFAGLLFREGEDLEFVFAEHPPAGVATATRALSSAWLEHLPGTDLEGRLAELFEGTPSLVSAFAGFLRGGPLPAEAGLDRDAILAAFAGLNRGQARERPLLLLIDDLHFASEEGRKLFAFLASAHVADRILLVGTTRPGLPPEYVAGLNRLDHVLHEELSRLDEMEVRGILEEALGSARVAGELAGRMTRASDGVPYFLFELLNSLRREDLLREKPDGTPVLTMPADRLPMPRPASIRDLVRSRILPLDEEDRELLEAAACCGFEFDPILVAGAVGIRPIPALKRLGYIERRHRIVRSFGRGFLFDHHHVHETIYEGLSVPLREEYHGALGEELERRELEAGRSPAEAAGETAVAIAAHLLRGDRGERARPWLASALDHLVNGFRYQRALELAELGLADGSGVHGTERARCLLTKARALRFTGRGQDTEELLREAFSLAGEDGPVALEIEIRRELGRGLWMSGRADEAATLLSETAALAVRETGETGAGPVYGDLGHVFAHVGKYDDAEGHYRRSLAAAREAGDRLAEANAIGSLGILAYERGHLEDAREHISRCLPMFRELGNVPGEARSAGNLGLVCIDQGDFRTSRRHLEQSLMLSRQLGYRRGEANALGNLGLIHRAMGRYGAALESLEHDLEIRREIGDRLNEGIALQLLGNVLLNVGDLTPAGEILHESLGILDEVGFHWGRSTTLHLMGILAWEAGDTTDAERRWREAEAVAREIGKTTTLGEALLSLGRMHLEAGEREKAREELTQCRDLGLEGGAPNNWVLAEALLLLLGGDPDEMRAVLEDQVAHLYQKSLIESRFLLWLADGRPEDLESARSLLASLVDHTPAEHRRGLLENVRLHRRILSAAGGATET